MEEFWMIMNEGNWLVDAQQRYKTANEAKEKALHHAKKTPGERYIVLHAIGMADLPELEPVWQAAEPSKG